tara:strand:- start:370 stop:549 length:180 start_codon:yes stop_codon:yes gene_type:complete
MNTERELVELFFGSDTTSDINDVVQYLIDLQYESGYSVTTEQVINELKTTETNISDWSI